MLKLNKTKLNILKAWIPLAIVITCLSGLIYLVVQQDIRIGANDPQIQIAQDVANQLSISQNPQNFIPPTKTDMSRSLATYIMIFDKNGKLIGSSVSLDGKDPVVPQEVFATTKKSPANETRFTWQPKTGIRSAVVLDYYQGPTPGFVLIGRSLREVENRENNLGLIVFLAWAVIMGTSLASVLFLQKIK